MIDIIVLLSILFVIWYTQLQYDKYISEKYKCKLFEVRDELRMLSIDGLVNKDEWAFDFVDKSISQKLKSLSLLNIYIAVILNIRYRNNKSIREMTKGAHYEINKNKDLKRVYDKYMNVSLRYLLDRHYILTNMFRIILLYVFFLRKLYKLMVRNAKVANEKLDFYPETSVATSLFY